MVNLTRPPKKKRLLIIALLVVIPLVTVLVWATTFRQKVTTIPATNTSTSTSTTSQNASSNPSTNNDKNPGATTPQNQNSPEGTGAGPMKPYGSFVSNHHPSVSGATAPSSMQSVCSGTPGAKCYISFTKGNEVRKLPEQTIASDNSTIWDWDINSAGLTAGTWEIKAISTLNGKTETAEDTLKLEVQP